MNLRSILPPALVLLVVACGGVHPAALSGSRGLPRPAASPAPKPTATAQGASAFPATFTGTIVHAPGSRLRYGPGLDMPVLDILPARSIETFDGWFRSIDEPQTDEISGQIEPWSRDWLHLADGRGWVHSAAVRGRQPAGMPQRPWQRPDSLPGPRAGLIEVALHKQEHPVTCEIASLQMALASRGIPRDESSLLRLIGVDRRPAQVGRDGIEGWGDPNQSFVGDPDGRISTHTGYGVYAAPIARAAERSGAPVIESGTGIAPSKIYSAVVAGHPAIVWAPNDFQPATVRTWRAWDGSTVPYTLNEHAVLVVGVTPTSILINDPLGSQRWLPKSTFEAAYATFNQMAVIIA